MATSWVAAPVATASPTEGIHLTITDSSPLNDAYFLYLYGSGTPGFNYYSLGNITAPGTTLDFSVPATDVVAYSIVGSYATGGITFGFRDPTLAVGQPYSSVVGSSPTDELNDYDSLVDGNAAATDFIDSTFSYGAALNSSVTLVNFSDGVEAGTATASVPEPLSSSTLCLCGSILMARRRRRHAVG